MATAGVEQHIPLIDLGESVSEATVTRWLKQPGDHLIVDEPLLEVSTDKVDTEVVSPVAGTLVRIVAEEGAVVAVGEPLAVVAEAGGTNDLAPVASVRDSSDVGDDEAELTASLVSTQALPAAPESSPPATSLPCPRRLMQPVPLKRPCQMAHPRLARPSRGFLEFGRPSLDG